MRTKTVQQSEKMLDAAARLFGSHRFHEVRMEDIAAEAEVGKGTLYRYFADKEELYLALLQRASQDFADRLHESASRGGGVRERLIAIIQATLEYFDAQPHLSDLIQRAEVMHGQGTQFPWQHVREEMVQLLTELFAEAHEKGEFTVRDRELTSLMLLGGLRSVIRFGKHARSPHLAEQILTDFLYGAAFPSRNRSTNGVG